MRARFPQRRRVSGPQRADKPYPRAAARTARAPSKSAPGRRPCPGCSGIVIVGMVAHDVHHGVPPDEPHVPVLHGDDGHRAVLSMQNQGANTEMSTLEVNSERAEYLRYLSGKSRRDPVAAANAQKASAEWSHPDPDVLEAVLGRPADVGAWRQRPRLPAHPLRPRRSDARLQDQGQACRLRSWTLSRSSRPRCKTCAPCSSRSPTAPRRSTSPVSA